MIDKTAILINDYQKRKTLTQNVIGQGFNKIFLNRQCK